MNEALKIVKENENIFMDMGFSNEEAKELQFRSFLMTILLKYIKTENLTQKAAAQKFGITQSRISNLAHGKIDLFSTSMLLAMLERAGFKIYENIQIKARDLFRYHDASIFTLLPKHNTVSNINATL